MELTPQLVKEGLEQYKDTIRADKMRLSSLIDGMTKNCLKDLVKSYMGVQLASEALQEEFKTNHDDATVKAFQLSIKLQDDCIGYMSLKQELQEDHNV